jgi:hypothetical protein
VGVFLIVALRTASMNSDAVGTGVMPCRPATEDMAAGMGWGEGSEGAGKVKGKREVVARRPQRQRGRVGGRSLGGSVSSD